MNSARWKLVHLDEPFREELNNPRAYFQRNAPWNSVPFMHRDFCDLGSQIQIQILLKERTHRPSQILVLARPPSSQKKRICQLALLFSGD